MLLMIGEFFATLVMYGIDRALPDIQPVRLSVPWSDLWRNLSWGELLPLVFAVDVALAILAWIIVGLILKLFVAGP